MSSLSIYDLSIIISYFMIIAVIGIIAGWRNKDIHDFVVGGKKIPWMAVLGSIIATEVSAVTFLATPGVGFNENLNYLQFSIGSIAARFIVVTAFLSVFYAINCYSIYEYLHHRFGPRTRNCAVLIFFITRIMASGVRLLIATIAFSVLLDISFELALILFTLVAVAYTAFGGIKAIIWTDTLQAIVFISAAVAMLIFLQYLIGWDDIWQTARYSNHLEVFHWQPYSGSETSNTLFSWFNDPTIFYLAILNGFLVTSAAMGTDQDLMQRMLTCKHVRYAQRSIIISGFMSLIIAICFLFIGIGIFAFYLNYPDPSLPHLISNGISSVDADKIFPYFIRYEVPAGVKGLLIIGIIAAAMSSLDSAIGAMSTSAVVDLYKPLKGKNFTPKRGLYISQILIIGFGLLLAMVAYIFKNNQGFLWLSFKLVSIGYGALLGIFFLGIFTKRGEDSKNFLAMATSCCITLTLFVLIEAKIIMLAWTWIILIGTASTFFLAILWGSKSEISYETYIR